MNKFVIVIGILIVTTALWSALFGGRLPMYFRNRPCQGKGWRRAFPDASKEEIRDFLLLFMEAFAFSDKEKLKLNPEDKVMDIYRALYPSKWMADVLELETLALRVQKRHAVDFGSLWSENLTLGGLFAACAASSLKQS